MYSFFQIKMKVLIIITALIACTLAEDIVYFTTENDNLDADEVMKHPDQIKAFVDCFVDRAPCDSLGLSYKKDMPEAISTACHRCNNAQKHLWSQFLSGLKQYYPEHYEDFQQKYDPNKIYLDALEKAVEEY
ncbi:ejaculatory bulb-specific protein 3-like [Pieris napi]|uniref:ejaculatory bulb-specific protein 3-like n=1 Tax=Pieris napi TaxID=78633 RepID=UPI001FB880BE|nr:ejaculatory bulb-specific protein 3-like [Pieris napi]